MGIHNLRNVIGFMRNREGKGQRASLSESGNKQGNVDILSIDANKIIYDGLHTLLTDKIFIEDKPEQEVEIVPGQISSVRKYRLVGQINGNPSEYFFNALLKAIMEKFSAIMSEYRRVQYLCIAFDGVAPIPKLIQQRTRRYAGSTNVVATIGEEEVLIFSSTWIIADSLLIRELCIQLENHQTIAGAKATIISGPDAPGEGEHKLLIMCRELVANITTKEKRQANITIMGNDNDFLLLLPLFVLSYNNVYPPNIVYHNDREFYSIAALINVIMSDMFSVDRTSKSSSRKMENPYELMMAFSVFMSLLGNDFVPPQIFSNHLYHENKNTVANSLLAYMAIKALCNTYLRTDGMLFTGPDNLGICRINFAVMATVFQSVATSDTLAKTFVYRDMPMSVINREDSQYNTKKLLHSLEWIPGLYDEGNADVTMGLLSGIFYSFMCEEVSVYYRMSTASGIMVPRDTTDIQIWAPEEMLVDAEIMAKQQASIQEQPTIELPVDMRIVFIAPSTTTESESSTLEIPDVVLQSMSLVFNLYRTDIYKVYADYVEKRDKSLKILVVGTMINSIRSALISRRDSKNNGDTDMSVLEVPLSGNTLTDFATLMTIDQFTVEDPHQLILEFIYAVTSEAESIGSSVQMDTSLMSDCMRCDGGNSVKFNFFELLKLPEGGTSMAKMLLDFEYTFNNSCDQCGQTFNDGMIFSVAPDVLILGISRFSEKIVSYDTEDGEVYQKIIDDDFKRSLALDPEVTLNVDNAPRKYERYAIIVRDSSSVYDFVHCPPSVNVDDDMLKTHSVVVIYRRGVISEPLRIILPNHLSSSPTATTSDADTSEKKSQKVVLHKSNLTKFFAPGTNFNYYQHTIITYYPFDVAPPELSCIAFGAATIDQLRKHGPGGKTPLNVMLRLPVTSAMLREMYISPDLDEAYTLAHHFAKPALGTFVSKFTQKYYTVPRYLQNTTTFNFIAFTEINDININISDGHLRFDEDDDVNYDKIQLFSEIYDHMEADGPNISKSRDIIVFDQYSYPVLSVIQPSIESKATRVTMTGRLNRGSVRGVGNFLGEILL
jgi:hypothetical protein